MMSLYPSGAEDLQDNKALELHGAEAQESVTKRLMQAIWAEPNEA